MTSRISRLRTVTILSFTILGLSGLACSLYEDPAYEPPKPDGGGKGGGSGSGSSATNGGSSGKGSGGGGGSSATNGGAAGRGSSGGGGSAGSGGKGGLGGTSGTGGGASGSGGSPPDASTADASIPSVGCYADSMTRDLPHMMYDSPSNTTEACIAACTQSGYLYAGTQYSTQCFCGNRYGSQGTSGSCNFPCAGNPNETCGGVYANSVYRTPVAPDAATVDEAGPDGSPTHDALPPDSSSPADASLSSIGCYADSMTRDLPFMAYESPNNTTEACISTCSDRGYLYAGAQYGTQCYCGNSYGSQGTSGGCNFPCAGNPNETCGGVYANSVYRTPVALDAAAVDEARLDGSPSSPLDSTPEAEVSPPLDELALESSSPADASLSSVGCYADSMTRDLPFMAYDSPSNTTEACIAACSQSRYLYAGAQYGTQCYCGNSYGGQGASGGCNFPCAGNPNETCGGVYANSVYRTPIAPDAAAVE